MSRPLRKKKNAERYFEGKNERNQYDTRDEKTHPNMNRLQMTTRGI